MTKANHQSDTKDIPQSDLNKNITNAFPENAFENVVCKTSAIKSRLQCVKCLFPLPYTLWWIIRLQGIAAVGFYTALFIHAMNGTSNIQGYRFVAATNFIPRLNTFYNIDRVNDIPH